MTRYFARLLSTLRKATVGCAQGVSDGCAGWSHIVVADDQLGGARIQLHGIPFPKALGSPDTKEPLGTCSV